MQQLQAQRPVVADTLQSISCLDPLFRPRSVAIVGASERSPWTRSVKRNMGVTQFQGRVHMVNRRGESVFGQAATTSCAAIGELVDVALLLIPASGLTAALDDLAAANIRNAVILSSGFAETGAEGLRLQTEVEAKARAHGITILGPNCLGFANFAAHSAVWAGTLQARSVAGNIAVVSQSGAVANTTNYFAHQQGVGLSCVISTGNEINFGIAAAIDYLVHDPATKVICVFMESVRDPAAFTTAAANAFARGKPLVVLKVGRSEITAKAAKAHTGALVGDDRVFDAICRQFGIVRVRSIEELVVTADVMAKVGPLRGSGVGLVSISGGLCEIAADLADAESVDLPAFNDETVAALRELLPAFATAQNPLDLTAVSTEQPILMQRVIETIAKDRSISLLCHLFEVPESQEDTSHFSLAALEHIGKGVAAAPGPVIVLASTMRAVSVSGREIIEKNSLPYVSGGLELGMPAISRAIRWLELHRGRSTSPRAAVPGAATPGGPLPRSEFEAQQYLVQFGVPVVPTAFVRTAAEAAEAATSMGARIVIKIASKDIAHKSDVGGVMLDLHPEDVRAAFDSMLATVKSRCPDATIDGALVSPMRHGGVELLVGVKQDPQWGPVLAVGLGGIFVELLKDTSLRLLPVSQADVGEMLAELRGARLLAGHRNVAAVDVGKLAEVIARIGQAAFALGPSLETLEVNPLLAMGTRIEALDALVVGR